MHSAAIIDSKRGSLPTCRRRLARMALSLFWLLKRIRPSTSFFLVAPRQQQQHGDGRRSSSSWMHGVATLRRRRRQQPWDGRPFSLDRPIRRCSSTAGSSTRRTSDPTTSCSTASEVQQQQQGAAAAAASTHSQHSPYVIHALVNDHSEEEPTTVTMITAEDAVRRALEQYRQQHEQQQQQQQQDSNSDNSTAAADDGDLLLLPPTPLTAAELIELGSVWYLSAPAVAGNNANNAANANNSNQNNHSKPTRVQRADFLLGAGDYLRIHHHPRRFPAVRDCDWSTTASSSSSSSSRVVVVRPKNGGDDEMDNNNDNETAEANEQKPAVVVAFDRTRGWMVVDKPPNLPVHATVDNRLENLSACLLRHNSNSLNYVTTPQRLDTNTSGLLVVSTTKAFAAYCAKLLRRKTELQLSSSSSSQGTNHATSSDGGGVTSSGVGGIHKFYRCLVCLLPPPETEKENSPSAKSTTWSVHATAQKLQSLAETGTVVRHFLEPSIRAPKRFAVEPEGDDWPECLLKIRRASPIYALQGNSPASRALRESLWSNEEQRPDRCPAVVEVEIELLTGRTHQIRGQLSACGCPLVGDAQYGGAQAVPQRPHRHHRNLDSERLALQCCELEFLDPDLDESGGDGGDVTLKRSDRWNRFRLESAWWTPLLQQYDDTMAASSGDDEATMTTSAADLASTISSTTDKESIRDESAPPKPARPELLPPRVQLSPGRHKYVLLRASHPSDPDTIQWFVKSASPHECGGPFHGNVAQDLREWIEAAGYKVVVTGGGRIDYRKVEGIAVVYGFSYGFGKGDHARAAALISEWSDIEASYDNAEGLY